MALKNVKCPVCDDILGQVDENFIPYGIEKEIKIECETDGLVYCILVDVE